MRSRPRDTYKRIVQALNALQAADLALYRAKSAGKDQFALFCDGLHSKAARQLELESALAQALTRREFALHYQPICRVEQGRPYVVGVEALLRWRFNDKPVAPHEFIPVLEESREIVRVGEWVLREACCQVRRWQQAGQTQLYCAVNLSIRQLQQPGFTDLLARRGLCPGGETSRPPRPCGRTLAAVWDKIGAINGRVYETRNDTSCVSRRATIDGGGMSRRGEGPESRRGRTEEIIRGAACRMRRFPGWRGRQAYGSFWSPELEFFSFI